MNEKEGWLASEMMSDDLYQKITDKYPNREVHIDISEDGENGAHIEYPSY